jgi:hypothetical protein
MTNRTSYWGLMSYLRYLCLFAYSGVQHILCCVFGLFVASCVLYATSFSGLSDNQSIDLFKYILNVNQEISIIITIKDILLLDQAKSAKAYIYTGIRSNIQFFHHILVFNIHYCFICVSWGLPSQAHLGCVLCHVWALWFFSLLPGTFNLFGLPVLTLIEPEECDFRNAFRAQHYIKKWNYTM